MSLQLFFLRETLREGMFCCCGLFYETVEIQAEGILGVERVGSET